MIRTDPLTGKIRYEVGFDRGILADAPATPDEGWVYLNSGDNKYYVFYNKDWREFIGILLGYYLLTETGDKILLEDGSKLMLE